MKKYFIIVLALLCSVVTWSKTAQEYLHSNNEWGSPYNYSDLCFDMSELYESKYGKYWNDQQRKQYEHDIQREKDKINSYVFKELPLKMDTNSLEYADMLLRWEQFFSYSNGFYPNEPDEKVRKVTQRIKKIVLPIEGKAERYIKAMQYEVSTWNNSKNTTNLSNDTIAIKETLLKEMLDCCHQVYRPSDSVYIHIVQQLFDLTYQPIPYGKDEDYDYDEELRRWHYDINFSVFLLQDLARWEDITEDEYKVFGSGDMIYDLVPPLSCACNNPHNRFPFILYTSFFMGDDNMSSRAGKNYSFYDICRIDREIVKRIAGVKAWYGAASERYITACTKEAYNISLKLEDHIVYDSLAVNLAGLTSRQLLEKAHECFKEIKEAGLLTTDDNEQYYAMMFSDIRNLMFRSNFTDELDAELNEVTEQAERSDLNVEAITAHQLQAEVALWKGNYKEAIKHQNEAVMLFNSLPEAKRDSIIANIDNSLALYTSVVRTAVITRNRKLWNTMILFQEQLGLLEYIEELRALYGLDRSVNGSRGILVILNSRDPYSPYKQKIDTLFENALKKVNKSIFPPASSIGDDRYQPSQDLLDEANAGDAESQYNCGAHYEFFGDYKEALEWYRKAAKQGHVKAQTCLGICYDFGYGVKQNYRNAIKWYTKAANEGDALAQFNLGCSYALAHGVREDYKKAIEWWRKAADQGNTDAKCNIGICYSNGDGVPQDDELAVLWYAIAAEDGHAYAQCLLGKAYYFGEGVSQDMEVALEWLTRSADQGYENAIEFLKEHAEELGYEE